MTLTPRQNKTRDLAINTMRLPVFSAYLAIDGESFSMPAEGQAMGLYPARNPSLEHHIVTLKSHRGCMSIKHSIIDHPEFANIPLGETRILVKDIDNVTVTTVNDKDDAVNLVRQHCPNFHKLVTAGAIVLGFDATNVEHNIKWLARKSLQVASRDTSNLLSSLSARLKPDKSKHFRMIVLRYGATEIDEQIGALRAWVQGVAQLKSIDANHHNPLDYLMQPGAIHKAGSITTSSLSTIPDLSVAASSQLEPFPMLTRFHSKLQFALMHLSGHKLDYTAQTTGKYVPYWDDSKAIMLQRIRALNALVFPHSNHGKLSRRSMEAFEYLLRFDAAKGASTNLFDELEGLRAFIDSSTAPAWLMDRIHDMDDAKIDTLRSLNVMDGHVKLVPGVAGSGKSLFLINLFLLLFYGRSGDKAPEHCKPLWNKALYCK
jgi:hypothetical protein